MSKTRHKHLESALIRLRKRIRRVQWLRGGAQCLAVLLFALLVLVVVDQRFAPLPTGLRWAMFLGWMLLGGGVAWWRLVRPLSEPLDTVRLARWLETRHPELDERASTVLELDEGRGTAGVSDTLLADLAVEAARDLDTIRPEHEVSLRRAKPWLVVLGVLAGIWLFLFVLWPARTARHLARVLAPASDLGTASWRILVSPGDADVMENNPVEIRVRIKGKPPEAPLQVVLVMDDGTEVVESMRPDSDGAVFRLEKAERDFSYYIRAGRETSDRHRITVWPLPRLADPRVRLEFPAYTNRSPREISLGAPDVQVNAIAGTRATLHAGLSTSVKSARMEIDGIETGETRIDRGADGGRLEISWSMTSPQAAEARIVLTHPIGGDFDALRFPANTLPDGAPEIHWLAPTRDELRLRPDDAFQFSWQASDDIGLAGAVLDIEADPGGPGTIPLVLPEPVKRLDSPTWRADGTQLVGTLLDRWPKARAFRLRVRVHDGRTAEFGGPNSSATPWKRIVIDRAAPSLARQELMAQDSEAKKALEEARHNAIEARHNLMGQRGNVESGKMTEQNRQKLALAREQLAKARNSLRDLSERMQEGVHAASTPKMDQAAENLEKALELAENAPISEDKDTRGQEMREAGESIQKALKQIEDIRNEINRRKYQVLDLAKLKELEQQQRELARRAADRAATQPESKQNPQASQSQQSQQPQQSRQSPESAQASQASPSRQNSENAASQNSPPPPDPQWRREQESTTAKIREAAQQRPKVRTALLEKQARQTRALAEQAAKQANTQRRLAEAAEQQSRQNPQNENGKPDTSADNQNSPSAESKARQQARETLRSTLAREQKALAREAEQSLTEARRQRLAAANPLPEAADAANQAAENLEKNNAESAAENAQSATEAMRKAASAQQTQASAQPDPEASKKSHNSHNSQPSHNSPSAQDTQKRLEAMAAAEELSDLAERQEQLAEAIDAFAKGEDAKARAALAELAARQTEQLKDDIESMSMVNHSSGTLGWAKQNARSASQQADQASEQASQFAQNPGARSDPGRARQEAAAHVRASKNLDRTATALSHAAEQFANQASQAANRRANRDKAPASPQAIAEAFSQAAQASQAQSSLKAAAHADQAARALSQATRDAMRAMQGRGSSQGAQPSQGQQNQQAKNSQKPSDGQADPNARNPQEGYRTPQADPGVPPELAKLGISTEDWAKIKAAIKSDTGSSEIQIPEEYRALVRQYFEQMAKKKGGEGR